MLLDKLINEHANINRAMKLQKIKTLKERVEPAPSSGVDGITVKNELAGLILEGQPIESLVDERVIAEARAEYRCVLMGLDIVEAGTSVIMA